MKVDIGLYDEPCLGVPTYHIDTTGGYKPSIQELRKTVFGCHRNE